MAVLPGGNAEGVPSNKRDETALKKFRRVKLPGFAKTDHPSHHRPRFRIFSIRLSQTLACDTKLCKSL